VKTVETALARPRKHFFFEMFTRDISLEGCALDLIDNSIDSFIRKNNTNISNLVFESNGHEKHPGTVELSCSDNEIRVRDNCGGIDYDDAKNFVFCFGHTEDEKLGKLGAYGIGLKRAMFKMGNNIRINSKTARNGFEMELNVSEWSKTDEWDFPIKKAASATSADREGTDIRITSLWPEVKMRLDDGSFLRTLYADIAQTYAFFINKCVRVSLNGKSIEAAPFPIGRSAEVKPAQDSFTADGVKVTLVAGIAAPGKQRTTEKAGWYVLCNGRVVVSADKTDLTGWGVGVPAFHNKYTRFIGIALFESKEPLKLPWTTTKRNVNQESVVFQRAKNVMSGMTKPITTFLNNLYPQDPKESIEDRDLLNSVREIPLSSITPRASSAFEVKRTNTPTPRTTAHIVYNVPIKSVERVRKAMGKPRYSDSEVGKFTFNHYLENECFD
jgi:hypothetical protein